MLALANLDTYPILVVLKNGHYLSDVILCRRDNYDNIAF